MAKARGKKGCVRAGKWRRQGGERAVLGRFVAKARAERIERRGAGGRKLP